MLLVGTVFGLVLGWGMGYLRLPYFENNAAFWIGFLTCIGLLGLLLAFLIVWNKGKLLGQLSGKGGGKKGRARAAIWLLIAALVAGGGLANAWFANERNALLAAESEEDKQRALEEAEWKETERLSKQGYLMVDVLDAVEEELKGNENGVLSDGVIRRVAELSKKLEPYRSLEGDSLSGRKRSPERAQLLLSLTLMDIDSVSFAQIKELGSFAGADLRKADLRGADLSGVDLKEADLADANLRGADLVAANLLQANLWGANLDTADLRKAHLRRADMQWAKVNGSDLREANLNGADLSNAKLRGADFRGAFFRWAKAEGGMFKGANFQESDLYGTYFGKANFEGADLSVTDLRKTKFVEADLTGAKLRLAAVEEEKWVEMAFDWRIKGADEMYKTFEVIDDTTGRIKFSKFCIERKAP